MKDATSIVQELVEAATLLRGQSLEELLANLDIHERPDWKAYRRAGEWNMIVRKSQCPVLFVTGTMGHSLGPNQMLLLVAAWSDATDWASR